MFIGWISTLIPFWKSQLEDQTFTFAWWHQVQLNLFLLDLLLPCLLVLRWGNVSPFGWGTICSHLCGFFPTHLKGRLFSLHHLFNIPFIIEVWQLAHKFCPKILKLQHFSFSSFLFLFLSGLILPFELANHHLCWF